MVKDSTNPVRRETSSRSCLTSEEVETAVAVGGGSETFAIVGADTSITLLASSASLVRSMELSMDAKTMRTLAGSR